MTLSALLFYFVAVCSVADDTACASENYTAERWPGDGAYLDYDVFGPFLSLEDCAAERALVPHRYAGDGEGSQKANPWSEQGESLCYAREIRVTIP